MNPPDDDRPIGLVDGSLPSTSRRFHVILEPDAVVQLDELLSVHQRLADGRAVTHHGIVVEGTGQIEGAELGSDTRRITADHTLPGETSRRVEVQVLRTVPELWLPPEPGAVVHRARGADRDSALFRDQMEQPLAVGLDLTGEPVYADFAFHQRRARAVMPRSPASVVWRPRRPTRCSCSTCCSRRRRGAHCSAPMPPRRTRSSST